MDVLVISRMHVYVAAGCSVLQRVAAIFGVKFSLWIVRVCVCVWVCACACVCFCVGVFICVCVCVS